MTDPSLIIVSRRPGMHRGGRAHPAFASYPLKDLPKLFTAEQMLQVAREPEFAMVVGHLVNSEEMVNELLSVAERHTATDQTAAAKKAPKGA